MAKDKESRGPQFIKYFGPVIAALKSLGGSGRPAEVKDLIAEQLSLSEADVNEALDSGASRFSNQVDWAKFYLSAAGYIDASTRGVWSLTEKGHSFAPSHAESLELFKRIHKQFKIDRDTRQSKEELVSTDGKEIKEEIEVISNEDYRVELRQILQSLPGSGFENLCQALLREAGFESVTVTGKSGDGGIDGVGILQMNPLVSFKVLFQCKRYSGSISPDKVRDFRGAMMGRADKGIILTTGTFTAESKKEAVRDGVPPIELVDGEKLLDMFEKLEFGLKPKQTFEIDREFFAKFDNHIKAQTRK
jgi:restriction system protein